MVRFLTTLAALLAMGGAGAAADATGEWLVKDRSARIKVVSCPQGANQPPALWGVIWAEKDPGFDTNNPDPSMRGRPMLGVPILINMQPTGPNTWAGKIYDPQGTALISGGGIYDATLTLNRKDMLEVRGCFAGMICDGEDWTRVTDPNTPPVPTATVPPAKASPPSKKAAIVTTAASATDPICSDVASRVPKR